MTMEIVNVGTIDNDPNCDSLRTSFTKLNNNLSILGNEVTVRAPKSTDDVTKGYVANNLYRFGSTVYAANSSIASYASWASLEPAGILPLDLALSVSNPLVAAYSMRRLTMAYTTNACVDVVRDSDSSILTIGFVNNVIDIATLAKFIQGTVGRISTWYDQSGNGRNATQTTPSYRPKIDPSLRIGKLPAIIFDPVQSGGTQFSPTYTPLECFLLLPSGVSGNSLNFAVVSAVRARSVAKPVAFLGLSSAASKNLSIAAQFPPTSAVQPVSLVQQNSTVFNIASSGAAASTSGNVVCFSSAASGVSSYNAEHIGLVSPTTILTDTWAGGNIGGNAQGIYGYMDMSELLIYSAALPTVDAIAVQATVYTGLEIYPQVRDVVAFDGDNIMEGYQSTKNKSIPRIISDVLDTPALVYNGAVSGSTVATRISTYASQIATLYNALTANNILVVAGGSNDLISYATPQTNALYTNLQSYVAAAHATGWKVIVCTVLPSASMTTANGRDPDRINYNNLLVANWSTFADGLINLAAHPVMGLFSNTSNTLYYADGTNPTDLGYSLLAGLVADAVNTLIT